MASRRNTQSSRGVSGATGPNGSPGVAPWTHRAGLAELQNTQGSVDPPDPEPGLPQDPIQQGDQISQDPPEVDLQTRDTSGVRILGPYPESGGWRCKIRTASGLRSAPMARTKAEAIRLAEHMAADLAKEGSITIRDALDLYVATKRKAGVRPSTLMGIRDAVGAYCRGMLDQPVGKLTTKRAQTQYEQLQAVVSVATHRAYLSRTKSWGRWVISRGWLRTSPVESIQGVGRRKRGKVQLSWDEGNRLGAVCFAEGSEAFR